MSGQAPALFVLGEIASGGMGTVELARLDDEAGQHLVAVKRMHPEYARDLDFLRMFRDEIWLMGSLSHPNIVRLIGWGEDSSGPYLVMEFVEGAALGSVASAGRRAGESIPADLVAYVAARAAEGLHAAHIYADSSGRPLEIVHRDITPSNLIVGFDGSVRITDFGIAKAAGKSGQTRTGVIKGKIGYMSPEYASRRSVDARSDLYSLGVVMFELLTGKTPFDAQSDFDLLKLVAYASAPSLISVAPATDAKLAALVDRLLSKQPDARPADGEDLAAALDAWLKARKRSREDLEKQLIEYTERHGSSRRRALQRMLEVAPEDTPADAEILRPKMSSDGTATFTFFQPLPDPNHSKPSEDSESRPRTRKVAVSDYPAGVPPPITIPAPPPAPPPPSGKHPIDSAPRTSPQPTTVVPAIPNAQPRSRSMPALIGAALASSTFAFILVLMTAPKLFRASGSNGASTEPSVDPASSGEPASDPAPAPTPVAWPPPVATSPEPSLSDLPLEDPPPDVAESVPSEATSATTAPRRFQPRAGKTPRRTGIVSPSSGNPGTKACTPASFDYPACLKPR